jgi:hypothetical protein
MSDSPSRGSKAKPKKAAAKKGPRGFKRTKTQISIRVEDTLLAMANKLATFWGTGITDVIEQGIMGECVRRLKEPPETRLVRFLVQRATPAEQKTVVRLLAYLRLEKEEMFHGDEKFRPIWLDVLESYEKDTPAVFRKALARYGEAPPVVQSELATAREYLARFVELERQQMEIQKLRGQRWLRALEAFEKTPIYQQLLERHGDLPAIKTEVGEAVESYDAVIAFVDSGVLNRAIDPGTRENAP